MVCIDVEDANRENVFHCACCHTHANVALVVCAVCLLQRGSTLGSKSQQ